MTYAEKHGVAL